MSFDDCFLADFQKKATYSKADKLDTDGGNHEIKSLIQSR